MSPENVMLREIRHRRTNPVGFHSHEVPRIGKFAETESSIEVSGVGDGPQEGRGDS